MSKTLIRHLVAAAAFGVGLGIAVLLMVPWERLVGLTF